MLGEGTPRPRQDKKTSRVSAATTAFSIIAGHGLALAQEGHQTLKHAAFNSVDINKGTCYSASSNHKQ
jgi:hypothetical protein